MDKRDKILIVDDAEINRSLLADMLGGRYEILEAADGAETLALLNQYHTDISLVLLDIVMPVMDGFEVLAVMKRSGWLESIPVITISAETSSSYIDRAYDLGATDYISRPFDEKTVRRRVRNTIMLYAKQKLLENMVTEQILEKEKNSFLMVEVLSNIVEFRGGESGLHVLHIRVITELLLRALMSLTDQYHMTSARAALIVNASALHDIGKIFVPEAILKKPGPLTPEEFEVMKNHSAVGAEILENTPCHQQEELLLVARDICRWHHERYDGGGYPDGLAGEDIPIAAQVVALADVYEALTNVRVYKPAYPHDAALKMILAGECGAFSPLLLRCLVEVAPQLPAALDSRDPGSVSQADSQRLTSQLLANGQASSRTLALLEQERTKYRFFASMSKEIQFEYNESTDLMTLSEWGADYLGLSEIIPHPAKNPELNEVFAREDYLDLHTRLRRATPADPLVSGTYCLQVRGEPRWYKAVARPLWAGEDATELTGTIGKFSDIHEEHQQMAAFKRMAGQDPLTKLRNHMSAREIIKKELDRKEGRYALVLFDLDHFKNANDQHGHMFGDEVLQFVARQVTANIRSGDVAARIGGDEFLIFTAFGGGVTALVRRLFTALTGQYNGFPISLSMGVALCPRDGQDYETLFHCADQALYAAKKNGKKQFCFYDSSIQGFLSVISPMDSTAGEEAAEPPGPGR